MRASQGAGGQDTGEPGVEAYPQENTARPKMSKSVSKNPIPIIDLFAGPGGLGEGFTSLPDAEGHRAFRIALSIEMDEFAHRTLTLRSFLRQFPLNRFPSEYYEFLEGKLTSLDELYKKYPEEAEHARQEAWRFEMGNPDDHEQIDDRVRKSLKGRKNFVLIGGPPCQAYSLVGRARRQEKEGLNKDDVRVYLYREYYRILAVHQPAVFVMENVKGLLSSKVDDQLIFRQLLQDLTDPVGSYRKLHGKNKLPKSRFGYRTYSLVMKPSQRELFEAEGFEPSDYIVRTEDYGIPQTRHRVIILGVREDLRVTPDILKPAPSRVTVSDVLKGLPHLRSGLSKEEDSGDEWQRAIRSVRRSGLKSQVDPVVWKEMVQALEALESPSNDRGAEFVRGKASVSEHKGWYLDSKLRGVINHETRSHIRSDLWRYLFVSCFGKVMKRSPRLDEFPPMLMPAHENAKSGDFANRFKVQLWNEPSKTITSHISKDGHYFIHPDPSQCRSLTVREAARIQTFPDNYFFCGQRTEQFHQVGNAVPPLLARQIAKVVLGIMS
jgi:DNA (cytosine-5)-methyltransferase 1